MPEGHGVQTSLALTGGSQTLARTGSLSLVQTFRNLLAVPSVHYQPAFAVAVAEVFALTPPAAVAIELSVARAPGSARVLLPHGGSRHERGGGMVRQQSRGILV